MFLYTIIILFLLNRIELWNIGQLKNTILWFIFTAVVSFLKISSIAEDLDYFIRTVKKNLGFLVVIEFLVSFYTFDFWVEFAIVPLTVILASTLVMAESDDKYKIAEKFVRNLFSFLGIVLILYVIYKLITDFSNFAQIKTFYDFTPKTF